MKTENKHTPGPWRAIEWSSHVPTTVARIENGKTTVIAECSGNGRHSDESIGDAALIAAAPELLSALEYLTEEYIKVGALCLEDFDLAKAAIAKAKGKAQ